MARALRLSLLAILPLALCSLEARAGAPVTVLRPSSWVPPPEGSLHTDATEPYPGYEAAEDLLSLVQLKISVPSKRTLIAEPEKMLYMREGGPGSPNQCGEKHPKDLYRPVAEVLAEHPGIDANCYFSWSAFWFVYSPLTDYTVKGRSAVLGMRENPITCLAWKGHGSGPKSTAYTELGTVTSHLDCSYYSYDDLYYYSLGWLKNQRVDGSLMTNTKSWKSLAAEECAMIQAEYQFSPEETTVGKHVDDNPGIGLHSVCSWTKFPFCKHATVREFKLHVYTKCLMGHAADEMAYAYMRACLLPGNVIGHGDVCGTCPDGKVCP